jgi:hypothetical protein
MFVTKLMLRLVLRLEMLRLVVPMQPQHRHQEARGKKLVDAEALKLRL